MEIKHTCTKGHVFTKKSHCKICPVCERRENNKTFFIPKLTAPARRALSANQISSLKDLAEFTEEQILAFHGLGPSSIPIIEKALDDEGLKFKKG